MSSLKQSYKILTEYRADPLGYVIKMKELNGHRTLLNVFGKELFIFSHPDDVLHVLKNNAAAYSKGRTTKALIQFLGKGLITNEGESWRKQHRLIRPIMHLKSILDLAPKILDTSLEFVPLMDAGPETNAFKEMNRITWRIILKTLFSQNINSELDDWLEEILFIMHVVTKKTRSSIPIPFWVPTPGHVRMKAVIKKFDDYVYGMINQRRKGGEKKTDMLQLLIDAQEEGTNRMSDLEIRDEIMTFMMAGHETITNTMTMVLITLAQQPEYKKKLEIEAAAFFKDQNFDWLNSSPWHTAVFDEILRLYPPVWVFMRQAEQEDQVGDIKIRKGANVVVAPYTSHRSADLWEKPNEFYPERFLPEVRKKIPQGAYYPFGLGPRACIGAAFAGIEGKIIMATMVHHFDWEIIGLERQTFEAGITLRPTNNLSMKFRRR